MSTTTEQLSDTERALLAREAAADGYRAGGYVYDQRQIRTAFSDGWDAAVKWMSKRASEGIAHLDDDESCHFQD